MVHAARFAAAAAEPARLPRLGLPEVAFAGRSNVGKSSLLNRLVGRRSLARVSKTPGRTQQINFFVVDEKLALVEHYLTRRRSLRAVVLIVDLRRGVEPDDAQLLAFLTAHGVPAVLVATKADKLAYGARVRQARVLAAATAPVPVVVCSAVSGDGIAELWARIRAHSGAAPPSERRPGAAPR